MASLTPKDGKLDEEDEWKRTCEFFNCRDTVERVDVDGILLPLEPYQAHAIWRVFTQIADKKIASIMIGDAPGLGKTGTSLTIAIIFAMLNIKYREVLREWDPSFDGRGRRHLPPKGSTILPGTPCPTQGTGILCPCNLSAASGLSNRVVVALQDFPTLVCCPPNIMSQWYAESEKWIDRGHNSPANGMRVMVYSGASGKKIHPPLVATEIRGDVVRQDESAVVRKDERYTLAPQTGSSSTIVIFSSQNATRFHAEFLDKVFPNLGQNTQPRRGRARRPPEPVRRYRLGCGIIFFDEYHQYRGTKASMTQPFEMLRGIRERCVRPVFAVGLSASLRQGPEYWRPFLEHALNSRREAPLAIGDVKNINDLDKYENDFKYLVEHLHRDEASQNTRGGRETNKRQEALKPFLQKFIPLMMIARKKTSIFRGVPCGSPATAINTVQANMSPGAAYDAVSAVAAGVKAYLNELYNSEVEQWRRDGEQGEQPNKRDFIKTRIMEAAEERPGRGIQEYNILSRSSCFPFVAVIHRQGNLDNDQFLSTGIAPLGNRISAMLHPQRLGALDVDEVQALFATSPFHAHKSDLWQESPKIRWVAKYIRYLILIRDQPRDSAAVNGSHGPPPPDNSNCRHALVMADQPLSAFLSMMLFGVAVPVRSQYATYMMENCNTDNRVKILVTTAKIFGVGHNLQRANTAILTEVLGSYENQKQAFGRVDRKGQQMKPWLYQLYDDRNLTEKIRMARNKNRKHLADHGHEGPQDDTFEQAANDITSFLDNAGNL
ncbi:hypothetical protein O1611_g9867 [Lasiodiplodia mahajangana]|uniref:Uncharacterized protein n=1 Tax=Lasiodiplodia mahajangana TaxID=1108764 RepID=A0ACC2J596_9PEZI|nr:hypothetical protein O1611_g9867 [Lasiodiplodia mahajangana]